MDIVVANSNDVNNPQQIVVNTIYNATSSTIWYTILPTSSQVGDEIGFINTDNTSNSKTFRVLQNADQYILAANKKSTTGTSGYVVIANNTKYYYYSLICIEENNGWLFTGWQALAGNLPNALTFI